MAKKVAKKAKSHERRLERYIASQARVERPEAPRHLHLVELAEGALDDGQLAVAAHDLYVSYGATLILDRVDMTLHSGERLALVGPNGGGRSTLLRLLTRQAVGGHGGTLRYGHGVRVG